jgi:hypothetical protein
MPGASTGPRRRAFQPYRFDLDEEARCSPIRHRRGVQPRPFSHGRGCCNASAKPFDGPGSRALNPLAVAVTAAAGEAARSTNVTRPAETRQARTKHRTHSFDLSGGLLFPPSRTTVVIVPVVARQVTLLREIPVYPFVDGGRRCSVPRWLRPTRSTSVESGRRIPSDDIARRTTQTDAVAAQNITA